MNPSTQMAILKDILTVLDRQGVKKFLILNSHGGNDFKTMLRELGLLFPDMLLVCRKFKFLYWLSAARCRIVELKGSMGGVS
jgi:creatinine amidohydrolase